MQINASPRPLALPFFFFLIYFFSCCPPLIAVAANTNQTQSTIVVLDSIIDGGSIPAAHHLPGAYVQCYGCPSLAPPPPQPKICPMPSPPPPPPPPPQTKICPTPSPPPPPPPPPSPPPPPPPKPKKCPPPLPPPPPPPPPPPTSTLNPELQQAINNIQNFKKRIKYDPRNITGTWTGDRICVDKSTYKGFICYNGESDKNFRIVGIVFNQYNFDGEPGSPLSIDRFIEDFKHLVLFHGNSNNFTGAIPLEISKIPNFFELDFSNNKYTGPFPKAVLGATNSTFLDLRYNHFSGPIPPQVFKLDLDVLFLNNNAFSGTIPENLGDAPVLYLTLANNQLTGPIPKSIGKMSTNLLEIVILNNHLSGCLPHEIGFLNKTTVFDASKNKLTGPIPYSFGCLEEMQIMNMSSNQLYGAVPESLCMLDDLEVLDFKNNYLTQVGVECRKLIKKGVLDVSMNCILDLPSQRSATECKAFFSKPRTCPLLNYVPCGSFYRSSNPQGKETSDQKTKKAFAPSPAYNALKNQHN